MRSELRVGLLVSLHVVLVIASVFVMDWVIRGRSSADLWAVSHCTDLICRSRPLDDAHATTVIWQTLLFSSLVIWQGGARALGIAGHRAVAMIAFMVGTVGVMSVMLMAVVFARTAGLTLAPLVLGVAYMVGFVALYAAVRANEMPLARARQVESARASRPA